MFTKSHMLVPIAPTNIGSSAASTFVEIYKISHERIWDTVLESEEVSHPIRGLIDYLKTVRWYCPKEIKKFLLDDL